MTFEIFNLMSVAGMSDRQRYRWPLLSHYYVCMFVKVNDENLVRQRAVGNIQIYLRHIVGQ